MDLPGRAVTWVGGFAKNFLTAIRPCIKTGKIHSNIYSKRVGKRKKAPAGVRAVKLAKAKKTSVPRKKVVRRETRSARSARKRLREEGDDAAEESPRKRRREDGDGDAAEESFEILSGGELDLEELTGDPTESEFEAAAGQPTPRQAAVETAKMCAGDKVKITRIL